MTEISARRRDRPILFTAEMIKAQIERRKTMTRRMLRQQPTEAPVASFTNVGLNLRSGASEWVAIGPDGTPAPAFKVNEHELRAEVSVPFAIGDRLWAKETFCAHWGDVTPNRGAHRILKGLIKQQNGSIEDVATCKDPLHAYYKQEFGIGKPFQHSTWKSGRFMPRWASRITLIVRAVKIERLQDISRDDAIAEGLVKLKATGRYVIAQGDQHFGGADHDPRIVYSFLWDIINGKGSWAKNPFVVALTFDVHEKNIDLMDAA